MIGRAVSLARHLSLPLAILTAVSVASLSPAHAADPQPEVVYQNIQEGDVLQQSAFGIQLCFASPVNRKDLDQGGDFAFNITEPDGLGLGSRVVFQSDGYGVTVYPAGPVGAAEGQWKFHYRLTSPDAHTALEGDTNYAVDPAGSPIPRATPPDCVASGGTATISPTPRPSTTPLPSTTPPVVTIASPVPTSSGAAVPATGSSSPDILKYALLAIGAAGAAAGVVLIGFVVRRRLGHDPHGRRPDDSDGTRH